MACDQRIILRFLFNNGMNAQLTETSIGWDWRSRWRTGSANLPQKLRSRSRKTPISPSGGYFRSDRRQSPPHLSNPDDMTAPMTSAILPRSRIVD
jgi:hypothetical protein